MRKRFLFLILLSYAIAGFATEPTKQLSSDRYEFILPEQAQQFEQLTHEIRCVVCENQSLADSSASIALDLKNKIRLMIANHQSNDEIKAYLIKRYGEFILLKPMFTPKTYVLWLFPFIGLMVIFFVWLAFARRVN